MKVSSIRKTFLFAFAAAFFGLGCELIVDFDRSRIPVESADAQAPGDSSVDSNTDTGVDSAVDASDAQPEAAPSDAGDGGDADADPDAT